jgi:hypothetical protein
MKVARLSALHTSRLYPQEIFLVFISVKRLSRPDWMIDGRLGLRLRGYHPVAPGPLRYRPFVHHLWFRPSSPEVHHVKRHEGPLLVKDGIGWWMAGQFGLWFRLPRKSQGSFTCRKSATWDRRLASPPKEGKLWIFLPEKSNGFGQVQTGDLGYQRPAC